MKAVRYVALSLSSLPTTYLLTGWWLESWLSERVWTWLNHAFGQNFGLATDVELLLAFSGAFSLSFTTMTFLFRVLQITYNTQNKNELVRMKDAVYGSLIGILVLFATYFIFWFMDFLGIQSVNADPRFAFWVNFSASSLMIVLVVSLLGWLLWRRIKNEQLSRTK